MKTAQSSELEFFVTLARHGSLAATARALNITPPAITMRLAAMESRLGVRLVNRTTRKISLTSEGELYLQHASRILQDLRDMEEQVASGGQTPRGPIRLNATLGFGRTVIAPLVSRFCKLHPDVQVNLEVTDRPVDLVDDGFDLAIRFGELPDSRLSARRIMSNRRFLCASPLYLKQCGTPRTLADLQHHRCIVHRQNNEAHGSWRFSKGKKSELIKVQAALASNDGDIVMEWALEGHGILIRSEWDLNKYLESGRLTRILTDYTLPSADLFVYFPAQLHLPVRVRKLIDFLIDNLAQQK